MNYNLDDLDNYLLLHGHNPNIEKLKITDDLINTIGSINNLEILNTKGFAIPKISKRNMINNSKNFIQNYFKLHNVGYLPTKKLEKLVNNEQIVSHEELVDILNKSAKMINPFKLPINFVYDNIYEGTLTTQVLILIDDPEFKELLKKLNVYFEDISLSKTVTEFTSVSYVHEIVHTQLESYKGIIENYYNSEVISIFLELLYSYNKDINLYYLNLLQRIKDLIIKFNNMYTYEVEHQQIKRKDFIYNDYNYHSDTKYLISILKSFNLLSKYFENNYPTKEYIIHQTNRVFEGHRTVEEYLNDLDVTYESSLEYNNVKKLIDKI